MIASKTKSIFHIVACYFVSIFYTDLYNAAVNDLKAGKSPSATEAYIFRLDRFISSLSYTDKASSSHYTKVIEGLYTYYTSHVGFTGTFAQWIDTVVREVVPPEFYSVMAPLDKRKDTILLGFLRDTILGFAAYVRESGINFVVNPSKRSRENSQLFSEKFVQLMLDERDRVYAKFIKSASTTAKVGASEEYCKQLQSRLAAIIKEKADVVTKYNKLCEYVNKLKSVASTQDTHIRMQSDEIFKLKCTIDELRAGTAKPAPATEPTPAQPPSPLLPEVAPETVAEEEAPAMPEEVSFDVP